MTTNAHIRKLTALTKRSIELDRALIADPAVYEEVRAIYRQVLAYDMAALNALERGDIGIYSDLLQKSSKTLISIMEVA